MSTPFPVDQFPLLQGAGQAGHEDGVKRDIMDDGEGRLRVTRTDQYTKLPLHFQPMYESDASALLAFLRANPTTVFALDYSGETWEGELWSVPTSEKSDGMWWVQSSFRGKLIT